MSSLNRVACPNFGLFDYEKETEFVDAVDINTIRKKIPN